MASEDGRPRSPSRKHCVHAAAVVGVFTALTGCRESNKAKPAPPPPTVYVEAVTRRDVSLSTEVVAALDGYVNADIRARVPGYLKSQDFKDGSAVKANQLLFKVEQTEYVAATAAAQANVQRAIAAEKRDALDLARNQALRADNAIAQASLDNAVASQGTSGAQVNASRAELAQAQLNLSYTMIRSPIAGVAGIAQVRVGNLVGKDGPTLLTTVSQIDPIRVTFPISEIVYVKNPERFKHLEKRDLAWAKSQFSKLEQSGHDENGDPGIELILADGSVYPRKGVVIAVNRAIDTSTGTIQLQALVPNPDGVLRPGQYGRVKIRQSDAGQNVLAVPEKAVISVQGTYSVAIVPSNDKVELRRVELGQAAKGWRIVTSGLREGERIVVEGLQKVAPGAPVKPVSAPKTAATTPPSPAGNARAND
jgi:membrane fusion protein (multidrug efflux system)